MVASYTTTTSDQTFDFQSGIRISANDVRIQFTNDAWDPANGIDLNLIVDRIAIDGVIYETEDPSVYSTGTWKSEDGIVPGYRQSEWMHSGGYFQYAASTNFTLPLSGGSDAVAAGEGPSFFANPNGVFDTDWVSNTVNITVTPSSSLWLPNVDFSRDASGTPLSAGTRITDQFASLGFTVSTNHPNKPAMIFDSAHPTGGDHDLGTPNSHFGGPGQGSGGQPSNDAPLGNVLIISEDNDAGDPDDNGSGGTLIFDFDNPVMIDELGIMDIDSSGNRVDLFDAAGVLISSTSITQVGNNGVGRVTLNAVDVSKMEVVFTGSGAITDIEFCRDGAPIAAAQTRFFVVDRNDDDVYRYANNGASLGDFDASAAYNPRGITTTSDGNPVWVISEEGSNERVYVYDTNGESLLGSWTAKSLSNPQGIATDGTDIWVVDRSSDKFKRYAGAASRLSGHQYPTDEFQLAYGNQDPRGITTDGNTIWVVDTGSDKVFAYDMDGDFVNWWDLDSDNSSPRGITINPNGGDGVWIVDGSDDAVYHYAHATLPTLGSQSAISVFDLAPGNNHPEGIADPIQAITLREFVDDQIDVAGEVDEYTFAADAGTELYIDATQLSGGPITATLLDPTNTAILTRTGFSTVNLDSGPITLDQTGTYTYRLAGNGSNTPNYAFTLWDVPPTITRSIELDQLVQDVFTTPGQSFRYQWTVDAGEEVFFDLARFPTPSGLDFHVTAPDGSTVLRRTGSAVIQIESSSVVLSDPGTYQLDVTAVNNGLGELEFRVWDVHPHSLLPGVLDVPVEGLLETPGTIEEFEYELSDGDVLFFDMQRFFDLLPLGNQRLISQWVSPTGVVLSSVNQSSVPTHDRHLEATEGDGTYTLRVLGDRDDMGQFQFKVHDVTEVVTQTIATEEIFSGAIEKSGQTKRFEFSANAGQTITIHPLLNEHTRFGYDSVALTISRPDGTILADDVRGTEALTFDVAGTYTIDVGSYVSRNGRDGTGRFAYVLSSSVTPPVVDSANLSVTDVTVAPVVVGNPAEVVLTWTVTNTGTVAAGTNDGWVDRVFFSADREFGGRTQRAVGQATRDTTLLPGESYTASTTITLPEDFEGGFWTYVRADAGHELFENAAIDDNTRRSDGITNVYAEARAIDQAPSLSLSPSDQSRFPTGTSLALTGSAVAENQSINAFFLFDVSASTLGSTGLDSNGDGVSDALDDFNGDGNVGDVLDTEIASILRLTEQLTTTSDDVRVSSIIFANSAELIDAGPADLGQFSADPLAESTFRPGPGDFETAIRSVGSNSVSWFRQANVIFGTSFSPAIAELQNSLAAAGPADRTLVYFLTDGAGTISGIDYSPFEDTGAEFYSFQIGSPDLDPRLVEMTDGIGAIDGVFARATAVGDPGDLTAGLLETVQIESVTINGTAVSAIDPAGNFFAPVTLIEGDNTFEAIATTTSGRVTTAEVTLVGEAPGSTFDLSSLLPAADGLAATFSGSTYNRFTDELHTSIAVTNDTTDPVKPPVTAVLENFSDASIDVPNFTLPLAGGSSVSEGRAYVNFDAELGNSLPVDATSDSIDLTFTNPTRTRFDFDVRFLTAENSSPIFTDIPVLSASIDTLYTSPVATFDADDDFVTVELIEAPEALLLLPSPSGGGAGGGGYELTWTPTASDTGHHRVVLQASDGRGGTSLREMTLLVDSGLPNNPPLITSDAPRFATVGETLTYDITAIDPELAPVSLTLENPPSGVSLAGNRLSWTPAGDQIGVSAVTVLASDPQGAIGRQTFRIDVRPVNTPPAFQTAPIETTSIGGTYVYAALATDDFDRVSYSITGPTGITISDQTGVVTWPAGDVVLGDYPVTITATDDRGASTDQTYTLSVTPDSTPPRVNVFAENSLLQVGETTRLFVRAVDDVAIDTVTLSVNGNPVTLDADGSFLFTATQPGRISVVADAIDTAGNAATASIDPALRVVDPTDDTPPVIAIDSPAPASVLTYLTEVVGDVVDDQLEFYELQVSPSGMDQYNTISRTDVPAGAGSGSVLDTALGTFDPTMLANDFYDLRVRAGDANGNISTLALPVSVEGGAKLGNFRIELTDLAIPLAGIPIQINRVYDTLDAPYNGDFGHGWKLDVATPRIRESVRISPAEAAGAGMFGANPFRLGTRVYLNAPDGRRVGFTFDPVPEGTILGTAWRPRFTPDPGVFHELEVPETLLRQFSDGTFGLYFGNFNYNPETYTLVTKDQLRYTYNQFADIQLQSIEDRNNVTLTFDDTGIHSSVGPSITWTRDDQGRITEILDTADNPLTYTYTTSGDLESFTDQVGNVTSMTYLDDPAHYLESITDPRGIQVLSLAYDEDGRLTGQGDALGNSTAQFYDLENNTEVTADRLGNETTLVFDDRGNITEERDPLGFSTFYQYDANDNEIAITNRRGFTTDYEYDDRGNVTKITDALGGEMVMTFNADNDMTSMTDELGRLTQYVLDADGNQLEMIDAAGNSMLQTFDDEGRVLTRTDRRGNTTTFEYGSGCACPSSPSKITHPDGAEQNFTYNQFGQVTSSTDELGNTTTFTYDNAGRPISTNGPDGQETMNVYQDNLLARQEVKISDTETQVTSFEYDNTGRLYRQTDAIGGVVELEFDAAGNVLSLTDPVGNVTSYEFDELNRQITETDPFDNDSTFQYDEEGNLTSRTDRLDRRIEFDYDELDRQTAELWYSPTDVLIDTKSFTYDAVDNLTAASDAASAYSYSYDLLDRLTTSSNAGTPNTPTVLLS